MNVLDDPARITAIVGHFGSGKTEIAVNLALRSADRGRALVLADLDVVDPYFRSRECASLFQKRHVQLISSSEGAADADMPSMPAEINRLFDDPSLCAVMDIGGDASGARVIARYRHRLIQGGADVFCVINANRPLTNTPEQAARYVSEIEKASGLTVSGLINNTHLLERTLPDDVYAGAELTEAVSKLTGIPIVFHSVREELAPRITGLEQDVLPLRLFMKKPWEIQ